MPAFYAHLCFARRTRETPPGNFISAYLPARWNAYYEAGAQGPDPLFFYNPAVRNPAGQLAHDIHESTGTKFFSEAAGRIQREPAGSARDAMTAYALGCICHLALDASCHPEIETCIQKNRVSHHEIEKEMDKYLMRRDGVDPFSFDFRTGLVPRRLDAGIIGRFYGVSSRTIRISLRHFLWLSRAFFTRRPWIRQSAFFALQVAGQYREAHGLFTNPEDNPHCSEFCREMADLLDANVPVCAKMQRDFMRYLGGQIQTLPAEFDRTFSVIGGKVIPEEKGRRK